MKTQLIKSSQTLVSLFLGCLFVLFGCQDLNELRKNPNEPSDVAPPMLFAWLQPSISSPFGSSNYSRYGQYHFSIRNDEDVSFIMYYADTRSSFDYRAIRNCDLLIEKGTKLGDLGEGYAALGVFFKAMYFFGMARVMGDVPLKEALKLDKGILLPKYDPQKDIFKYVLDNLDKANSRIATAITKKSIIQSDLYYDNDLKKWQKAINAYTLRVLMELSRVADDATLDVKNRFKKIVSDPNKYPIFQSTDDDMKWSYEDVNGRRYALNPGNPEAHFVYLTDNFVELLKKNKDPRLFKISDPSVKELEAKQKLGQTEETIRADFANYKGVDISGVKRNTVQAKEDNNNKVYSKPNQERYLSPKGQPAVYLGYVEQELHIAEAALRGWVTQDAKKHYENAVKASMSIFGIGASEITDFLAKGGQFPSSSALQMEKVLEQKYVAFFENSNREAYFNERRTRSAAGRFKHLVFNKSENTDQEINNIPIRWLYPSSEITDNKKHVEQAIKRQFGNKNDTQGVLWHLK